MQLYLDERGAIAALPSRVQILADHFGAIVMAISPRPIEVVAATKGPCRRRPGRRRCTGVIEGLIDADDRRIHWICRACEDQGGSRAGRARRGMRGETERCTEPARPWLAISARGRRD